MSNLTIEQYSDSPEGFEGKTINVGDVGDTITTTGSMGDVQAGIEFIYHMREHILDIGVATLYLFACYAFYLWLKKVIK